MTRRSYRPEQIIEKLKEAEVLVSKGSTTGEIGEEIEVTEWVYHNFEENMMRYRSYLSIKNP